MMNAHMTYFHNSKANRSFESSHLFYLGDVVPGDRGIEPWNLKRGIFLCFYGEVHTQCHTTQRKVKNPLLLFVLSQLDLRYGKFILVLIQSIFYVLFIDWTDMI